MDRDELKAWLEPYLPLLARIANLAVLLFWATIYYGPIKKFLTHPPAIADGAQEHQAETVSDEIHDALLSFAAAAKRAAVRAGTWIRERIIAPTAPVVRALIRRVVAEGPGALMSILPVSVAVIGGVYILPNAAIFAASFFPNAAKERAFGSALSEPVKYAGYIFGIFGFYYGCRGFMTKSTAKQARLGFEVIFWFLSIIFRAAALELAGECPYTFLQLPLPLLEYQEDSISALLYAFAFKGLSSLIFLDFLPEPPQDEADLTESLPAEEEEEEKDGNKPSASTSA